MKDNDLYSPTYLDLLNFFYRHSFPSLLGGLATSVAMGIAYKWNSLLRPAQFNMANSELCHLSGVESNIGRSRQRVCELCKVGGIPLFTYISNGQKRAGIYKININLLSNSYQIDIKKTSNSYHIDNDLRDRDQRSETEIRDPPDYPIDGYIPEGKKIKGSLKGRSGKEVNELWEGYEYYGYTRQKYDAELTRYGFEHMAECMELRIDEEDKGKTVDNEQGYMAAIVRNRWMEKSNGQTRRNS